MKWSEDLVAISLGIFLLGMACVAYVLLPMLSASPESGLMIDSSFGELLKIMVVKPSTWQYSPLTGLEKSGLVVGYIVLFGFLALFFGIGVKLLGERIGSFIRGFIVVLLIGLLANLLASQTDFKSMGLGYALWAIGLGIFINNTFGLPDWLRGALRHELYIKTGLVLLGAEVLFGKVMAIGLPGIFVAWVVTPIVLVTTYWFGQRVLKIGSKTLNMTISADMSVCGVSAAIATAAACKAKKEELTTAIGLSMVFTSVMMVLMPIFIKAVEMPEVLGGAWLGGTIDATGAVVAAGAFLGDTALNVAATIKMIQNILIGIIAFAVAVYWSSHVEKDSGTKVSSKEIWTRFPKFILGFIGTSIVFSLLHHGLGQELSSSLIEKGLFGFTKHIRGWLFCIAFVSIGLSTNFSELKNQFSGGKPLILYLVGQLFNMALTLLMAWIMFYKVFPEITEKL